MKQWDFVSGGIVLDRPNAPVTNAQEPNFTCTEWMQVSESIGLSHSRWIYSILQPSRSSRHPLTWRKIEQPECKARVSASKAYEKTLPLFIIIISRVTNQAGPDQSCTKRSRSSPSQATSGETTRDHPPPCCAPCCGNIKKGLEDCDESSTAGSSSSKRCPSRPKRFQTPGRPDRTASYHIIS